MAGGKLRETLSRLMVPAQGVFLVGGGCVRGRERLRLRGGEKRSPEGKIMRLER